MASTEFDGWWGNDSVGCLLVTRWQIECFLELNHWENKSTTVRSSFIIKL